MIFLIFLLGLAVGSFLNAYIWRLNKEESVWRGRSMCPKCKKTLQWYELIPLLSFIIQRGRCRGCNQKIDWQYPLVELAADVLFWAAFYQATSYQLPATILIMYWYFIAVLITLFVYDLRYGLVPDRVVLPAIVVALIGNIILPSTSLGNILFSIFYFLFSTIIGAGFFAIQHYASRGRWVGAGDIRFGALMGAMLGWPQILIGLLVSYIIGGIVAAGLLVVGQKKFGQTVPMGTFLAVGTVITLLWGTKILNIYFGF